MVRTALPIPPEKITLKILLHSPVVSTPEAPPTDPSPKTVEPIPVPKPEKPRIITPPKPTEIAQSKPTIPTPQNIPAVTPPAALPKTPEAAPAALPKAPPPPPKAQENYEEENLGRIRTILAERLKYPKNALRLKQQGETSVTFTLGTNRDVSQITITQSSGFELLDDAARSLIENSASEFPKPSKSVRITVPISYKLR